MKTIQINVDAALAEEYRQNYLEAFPSKKTDRMTLEQFISRFTEDRLREEIEFVEGEIQHA